MGTRRITLALVGALFAVTACKGLPLNVPTPTGGGKRPVKAAASERPALVPGLAPEGPTRLVPAGGPVVTLTGKVKLLSDHGGGIIAGNTAGIISNNTGGLIANNGGGLISDHGGGLVSDAGGGIVGKTKYAIAQAPEAPAAAREFLLADARVTVHDAAGNQLLDAAGKPIVALSDGQGGYKLEARLPAENLVLRARLWNGGELSAILAKGEGQTREVPIDTAATLGANYVLTRFVKGDQQTFDKLPASEAERLQRELETARVHVVGVPKYEPEALLALADDLRQKAPAVDKTLADIEVLLLGGLGDGKPADRVALNQPRALVVGPDGTLYIAENNFGRVRTVSPDGLLTTLLDGTGGKIPYNVPDLLGMALAPDGALYLVSGDARRVSRVAPGGPPVVVAGGGSDAGPPEGRPATTLALEPRAVAVGPAGVLYVGESSTARLLAIAPDGATTAIAPPAAWAEGGNVVSLLVPADGTLLAVRSKGERGDVWRRAQDGGWTELLGGLKMGSGGAALAPDGTIYVVEEGRQLVHRLAPDGTTTLVAGAGVAGGPTLVTPTAAAVGPDGTLYVADRRTNLVHARKPDGSWRLAAGATGDSLASDGFLSFNGPAGVAFDPSGRMVVAESTGHAIKRFDGQTLTTIAGGIKGDAGDGGPALEARFDTPGALMYKGEDLLVVDSRNQRIRAIGPDGVIRALVGPEHGGTELPLQPGVPRAAAEHYIKGGSSIVVGPDGLIYFGSSGNHQVARLRADGQVELVAGRPYAEDEQADDAGDGGEATRAGLLAPLGLIFDAQGDLLVADTGNMRIRKVTGLAPGGTPRIAQVAGLSRGEMLGKLFGLEPGWERAEEGVAASGAMIIGPAALCFDAAGNLYFGEAGTANIASLTVEGDSVSEQTGLDLKLLPPVPPRIRKITPDGRIFTVGGPGAPLFDPAKGEGLGLPTGLAIDPQGRLVVVDVRENAIRLVPKGGY